MCYCFQVHNLTFKKAVPAIVFIIILMLMFFLSVLDLKQKAEKLKEAVEARRKAEEKIYLLGKFDPAQREDFALVQKESLIVGASNIYLRKETLDAFLRMETAAEKDDVEIKLASATRNFDYQRNMWNSEWTGETLIRGENFAKNFPNELDRFKKILEYTAAPGTSRHHWGTDIDINGASPIYFEAEKGINEYLWLVKNAPKFGFCQTYRAREVDRRTGYNEEKWHWSYLPLSRPLTQEYKNLITEEDIQGFLGDKYASEQDLINDYVLDINPACL